MDTIKEVLQVLAKRDVIMIGPLLRACDRGRRWENTRALVLLGDIVMFVVR